MGSTAMSKTMSLRIDKELLARLRAKHGRSLADRVRDAIGGLPSNPQPARLPESRWSLILDEGNVALLATYAKARGITSTEAVREIASSLI